MFENKHGYINIGFSLGYYEKKGLVCYIRKLYLKFLII